MWMVTMETHHGPGDNVASRRKFFVFFAAKGKTTRVEQSQIGNVAHHWHAHSESGGGGRTRFLNRSDILRTKFQMTRGCQESEGKSVDNPPQGSHLTEETKSLAAALKIMLLYIAVWRTDELQLDNVVFGVLKSKPRRLFRNRFADNPGMKLSKRDAVAGMITARESLSDEIL
jgi:hypothetical protein